MQVQVQTQNVFSYAKNPACRSGWPERCNLGDFKTDNYYETLDFVTSKSVSMRRLKNIHPGEILKEEFLVPMNISAYKLSKDTFIPQTRISEILKGNRRVTADTALRLGNYLGTTPKFWLGLQDDFDIEESTRNIKKDLGSIKANSQNVA